jgi:hypothetical protein
MFRHGFILVALCAGLPVLGDEAASNPRIERIERLLGEVRAELDSLKREAAVAESRGPDPIYRELLTERQRKLAAATRTEFHTSAAGYTTSGNHPLSMHVLHWMDPWGVKLEFGAIVTDNTRRTGMNLTGLYEIHRFSSFELLDTRLYTFAGAGYFWRRVANDNHIQQNWHDTPERSVRVQAGVGTELSFFNLGGVRFSPEAGLRTIAFVTRYQDSESYIFERPSSDFSLDPFFAFHMSFYFR